MLQQALMAAEEEVKARATSRKARYSGPILRYHSRKQGDTSVVCLTAFLTSLKYMQAYRLSAGQYMCSEDKLSQSEVGRDGGW